MNDMSPDTIPTQMLHVTSMTGQSAEIAAPDSRADLEQALRAAGFAADTPVILSARKPQSLPVMPVMPGPADMVHLSAQDLASMNAPAVPQPDGPNWIAPARSDTEEVCTVGFWPSSTAGNVPHVSALNGIVHPQVLPGNKMAPAFPSPVDFRLSCYWQNVAAFTIQGPQKFDHAVTTTVGMSETEQTSLSAEIGVSTPHLSAKLSETVSQSVTIGAEHSVTNTYSIDPGANQTAVWVLWQLVQVFEFLDQSGQVITYNGNFTAGITNIMFGDLSFQGQFEHQVPMVHAAQSMFTN